MTSPMNAGRAMDAPVQSPPAEADQQLSKATHKLRRAAVQAIVFGSIGLAIVLFGVALSVVGSGGSLSAFLMTGWLFVIPFGLLAAVFGLIGLFRSVAAGLAAKRYAVSDNPAALAERSDSLRRWGVMLSLTSFLALPITLVWLAFAG